VNIKPVIRSLISGLLLCIFTFSITPKQWLHDIVTRHKDSYANSIDGKIILTTAGFHCNCESLVVQSPFIHYDSPAEINAPAFFVLHQTPAVINLISAHHFFSELRGPPNRVNQVQYSS
jgi:hypothetical protein